MPGENEKLTSEIRFVLDLLCTASVRWFVGTTDFSVSSLSFSCCVLLGISEILIFYSVILLIIDK